MATYYQRACKDCGEKFTYSDAVLADIARSKSPPERCEKHRKSNTEGINAVAIAYWQAPLAINNTEQAIGKKGLYHLEHPDSQIESIKTQSAVSEFNLSEQDISKLKGKSREIAERFLPISHIADELVERMLAPDAPQFYIADAPTGTGKSTWIPLRILRSPIGEHGKICLTQPRLITLRDDSESEEADTLPWFIAELLGAPSVGAGQEIGFQYSGVYDQHDHYTKGVLVTDGTLINWVINGRIADYSVVIIDEAHEQSENMEILFVLLRHLAPLYPHLKVVIASATIDIERYQKYFGGDDPEKNVFIPPSSLTLKGKTRYEICIRHIDDYGKVLPDFPNPSEDNDPGKTLPVSVSRLIKAIRSQPGFCKLVKNRKGDIVVFLPTVNVIKDAKEEIEKLNLPDLEIFPLHSKISKDENNLFKQSEERTAALLERGKRPKKQRVFLATNYAETSITISNLRYVIDSGFINQVAHDRTLGSDNANPFTEHSQAGCTQRSGRVGRVSNGECFRLYTKENFDSRREKPVPEISLKSLDFFLLKLKSAGIENLRSIRWLGYPETDSREIEHAINALEEQGALDADGDVTDTGNQLQKITAPNISLARFMYDSEIFGCALEVAVFIGFVNAKRLPFEYTKEGLISYHSWRKGCLDDLEFYLKIYHHWSLQKNKKSWAFQNGINFNRMHDIEEEVQKNIDAFSKRTHDNLTERNIDNWGRLFRVRIILARCMSEWLYVQNKKGFVKEKDTFLPYDPKKCPFPGTVRIDRDSACLGVGEVTAFVCADRRRVNNDTVYASHIVRVEPSWISHLQKSRAALAHFIKTQAKNSVVEQCAVRITQLPEETSSVESYGKDQEIIVRAIKRTTDGGRDVWLAHDEGGNNDVLINFTKHTEFELNRRYRARVTIIDKKNNILNLTQVGADDIPIRSIAGAYKKDQEVQIRTIQSKRFRGKGIWIARDESRNDSILIYPTTYTNLQTGAHYTVKVASVDEANNILNLAPIKIPETPRQSQAQSQPVKTPSYSSSPRNTSTHINSRKRKTEATAQTEFLEFFGRAVVAVLIAIIIFLIILGVGKIILGLFSKGNAETKAESKPKIPVSVYIDRCTERRVLACKYNSEYIRRNANREWQIQGLRDCERSKNTYYKLCNRKFYDTVPWERIGSHSVLDYCTRHKTFDYRYICNLNEALCRAEEYEARNFCEEYLDDLWPGSRVSR